jgi:hypothetical protein
VRFARTEGIIPAPEPAHAIRAVIEEAEAAKQAGEERTILFGLCGHGNFDLAAYDAYLAGDLEDPDFNEDDMPPPGAHPGQRAVDRIAKPANRTRAPRGRTVALKRALDERGEAPLGASTHVARQRQAVRAGRTHQREARGDPRARSAAADLEPVGEVAHQRQAEPTPGLSTRGRMPRPSSSTAICTPCRPGWRTRGRCRADPGRDTRAAQHS